MPLRVIFWTVVCGLLVFATGCTEDTAGTAEAPEAPKALSVREAVEPETVVHATDADFAAKVQGAKGLVLVDFYAPWCGPCQVFAPTFTKLADVYAGRVRFVKVDVDKSPRVSVKHGIEGIPTLILFKDGKPLGAPAVGLQSESAVEAMLDRAL